MATKDADLKKQLIREGITGVVALILLFVGGILLSNYDEDVQSQRRIRESENAAVRAEQEAIQQELGTGLEVSAFYTTYTKYRNGDLLLKRDAATQWMSALREKDHLTNLSVTISPVSDITPEFIRIRSGTMTRSEIKLSFAGVTDNSVYGFIEDLQRKLPGVIVVEDIKIMRTAALSRNVLIDLSQHKLTPLINGELTFLWLGIRPPDAPDAPSGSPSSKGSAHGL